MRGVGQSRKCYRNSEIPLVGPLLAWYRGGVAGTPRSPKASAGRARRQISRPATYSHDYPTGGGHDYVLKAIPTDIWERAKKRAHGEQLAVRSVLIRALDLYGRGRLNP
jgi:hypothetical protein